MPIRSRLSVTDFPLARAYPGLFTAEEEKHLAALMEEPVTHAPRTRVVRAQVPLTTSLYLVNGFLGRYSCDRLGRRQFTGLQIPGDYADIPAYPLRMMDHNIDALGEVTVQHTPHARLTEVVDTMPDLTRKLWRISLIDASIHRYWVFRIGRLAGKTKLANFFAEMFLRLYTRGLATPDGYVLTLSQTDLAEACGMTPVHLNRLLGELRLDGICIFAAGRVEILDLPKLFRVGEHTRAYLYLPDRIEAEVRALVGP